MPNPTHPPQRIFFDGEMRPIEQVFSIMRDGGHTDDEIFGSFEFKLGVGRFAALKETESTYAR